MLIFEHRFIVTFLLLTEINVFCFYQVTTFNDRPGYERVSSTQVKQREFYAATLIKRAWKHHHQEELKNLARLSAKQKLEVEF